MLRFYYFVEIRCWEIALNMNNQPSRELAQGWELIPSGEARHSPRLESLALAWMNYSCCPTARQILLCMGEQFSIFSVDAKKVDNLVQILYNKYIFE